MAGPNWEEVRTYEVGWKETKIDSPYYLKFLQHFVFMIIRITCIDKLQWSETGCRHGISPKICDHHDSRYLRNNQVIGYMDNMT